MASQLRCTSKSVEWYVGQRSSLTAVLSVRTSHSSRSNPKEADSPSWCGAVSEVSVANGGLAPTLGVGVERGASAATLGERGIRAALIRPGDGQHPTDFDAAARVWLQAKDNAEVLRVSVRPAGARHRFHCVAVLDSPQIQYTRRHSLQLPTVRQTEIPQNKASVIEPYAVHGLLPPLG